MGLISRIQSDHLGELISTLRQEHYSNLEKGNSRIFIRDEGIRKHLSAIASDAFGHLKELFESQGRNGVEEWSTERVIVTVSSMRKYLTWDDSLLLSRDLFSGKLSEYISVLEHLGDNVKTAISRIKCSFKDASERSLAIATFVNSHGIALNELLSAEMSKDEIVALTPYLESVLISAGDLDDILPEILHGPKIKSLFIERSFSYLFSSRNNNPPSQIRSLPSMPNCKRIRIKNCLDMLSISEQPVCKDFRAIGCRNLRLLGGLPECITFQLESCYFIKLLPQLLACEDFTISQLPGLTNRPELPKCPAPVITACDALQGNFAFSEDIPHLSCDLNIEGDPVKEAKMKKKSGHCWDCIGIKPNENGGSLYIYRLRDEFKAKRLGSEEWKQKEKMFIEKNMSQLFPATEPSEPLFQKNDHDLLDSLGYISYRHDDIRHDSLVHFSTQWEVLPDEEALMRNWAKIREKRPELPELRIAVSEGIASHAEYIRAFLTHDVLLSVGVEFFHDQHFHVIPTLEAMLSETYTNNRKRLNEIIQLGVDCIEGEKKKGELNAEQINQPECGLSYFVDVSSSNLSQVLRNIQTSNLTNEEILRKSLRQMKQDLQDDINENLPSIPLLPRLSDFIKDVSESVDLWEKLLPSVSLDLP
ncbi:MAG: hypothetical protein WCG42_09750 [Parachlamydiaceae bacterium]